MLGEKTNGPFLKCSSCGFVWSARSEFLGDPSVTLTGYQPHFHRLEAGFFYFTHETCHTTMMLPVGEFADLDAGPVFSEPLVESEACLGHCKRWRDLQPCERKCECAWVRRLLGKIHALLSGAVG